MHPLTQQEKIMEQGSVESQDQRFNINRLVELSNKAKNKYAKKGIFFTTPTESINSKPINLYNQGAPVKQWSIDPEKIARNNFKIFSTGDAFSLMSPDIEINGASIMIHVGVEHASYSPEVLIHEALQLCRCAYEHGARSITIALPDHFHPVVNHNDFNGLLMKLFKASGANKIYYYDKSYTGKLDENNINATIPLTISHQEDKERYQIDRRNLCEYLHFSNEDDLSLDYKVMHLTRKNYFNRLWSKFDPNKTDMTQYLGLNEQATEIIIPEIKAQQHVLLCCSANRPLAEEIAANLRMRGESVRLYPIQGQGEHAKISEVVEICGAEVTIVQSTRPNPDHSEDVQQYQKNGASAYFFEALTVARQAHLRGAAKINLINPYQFSARSDKAEDNPKGKTGAYVQLNGLLLEAAGVNQVITAECHDVHTMSGSYTGKNIKGFAVSALSVIATKIASEWLDDPKHPMNGQLRLVTPDAGAAKRTKELTLQLQAILGKKLCETRILGDKQRDSHQDDSALINSLNSGDVSINPDDKYLITDDETATGSTLCQAIMNLKKNGAKDIAVIVVHNNMPIDWLERQLCLARFLYLGVNDLHFSNTQEMGTLTTNYTDLINSSVQRTQLPGIEVEKQILAWFKKNISANFSDKTDEHLTQEFIQFKSMFQDFNSRIKIHSLDNEFASKIAIKSYVKKSYACASEETDIQRMYTANKGSLLFFPNQPRKGEGQANRELVAQNSSVLAASN